MLRPAKPRMAGSSVTDAAMTTSTASTTVKANPFMAGCPISRMPSIEMTTVRPANSTARPAVAIAVRVARSGILAVGQAAAEPRDDQQRVVDADADADHGRGVRRPLRYVDDPAQHLAERHRDAESEQRRDAGAGPSRPRSRR